MLAGTDAVDITGAQLRWFAYWLKGEENGLLDEPPVKLFVMGADQWREEDTLHPSYLTLPLIERD